MRCAGVLEGDQMPRLRCDLVGEIPVASGERIPKRRDGLVRRPVPPCAQPLHQAEIARSRPPQLRPQELEEQRVVAVAELRAGVTGDEEVGRRELGQHPPAVTSAGQRVGQLRTDRVGHGGAEQELSQAVGLPIEDLVQQVVGHRPIVAGEPAQEPGAVRLRGERQRGEADPGSPPFRPIAQSLDVAVCELGGERLQQSRRTRPR